ncbi:MAG: T9SS type A sorting domain-containing protein [Bacteroidia bacterium]
MKKAFLLLFLALQSITGFAQNSRVQPATSNQVTQNFYDAALTRPSKNAPLQPLYANDVIIENQVGVNQREVVIASSSNGWFYAAYTTYNAATQGNGLGLSKSTDGGITWTVSDYFEFPFTRISNIDLVVTGLNQNNLLAFVSYVFLDSASMEYSLRVDKHDATNDTFLTTAYLLDHGTDKINDAAIASDYLYPATGSAPYSIGVAYSTLNVSTDTVVFVASDDAGTTWNIRETLLNTLYYTRSIDLSYGHSASSSDGQYFAVWEQTIYQTDTNASIMFSRNVSTFDGNWSNPQNLDSLTVLTAGKCRHPKIATAFSALDNASGGITAMIVFERQYQNADYDIASYYNLHAENANNWQMFDMVASGDQELQPDVVFDYNNHFFLATMFDSTDGNMLLYFEPFDIPDLSWSAATASYNDMTTNLIAPWPQVAYDPVSSLSINAWIAEGPGSNGIAMFDAEVANGLKEENLLLFTDVFPNPANANTTISYNLKTSGEVQINIYNILGESIQTQTINATSGKNQTTLNIENLPDGVYMIQIQIGTSIATKSLVIVR